MDKGISEEAKKKIVGIIMREKAKQKENGEGMATDKPLNTKVIRK